MIELSGTNMTLVVIVAVIALAALGVAAVLVRQVLSASEGTDRMKEIAGAIQEGASAYLTRQFKTLAIFAVIVFFVLFLLPAETTGSASDAVSSSWSGPCSPAPPATSACGSRCAATCALLLLPTTLAVSRRP